MVLVESERAGNERFPGSTSSTKRATQEEETAVDEDDCEEDSAKDCEEDCDLSEDCSGSEKQGSKTKKARKSRCPNKHDKKWDTMYRSLLEYKAQHGNTLVPTIYGKNPQLGNWVHHKKKRHSKKQLSINRVLRLESIGFGWCARKLIENTNWESMFQLLV